MLRITEQAHGKAASRSGLACQDGFTLVEVLIVLMIVAIAALIVLPNLQRTAVRARSTSGMASVVGPFNLARSEAVKRRSPVGVWYREAERVMVVFEDWDPNNAELPTNADGVLNGAEQTLLRLQFPDALVADSGTQIVTVVYRTDGTLDTLQSVPTDGGVARFVDKAGNQFQLRINGSTGSVSVEGRTSDGGWSTVKEAWQWKY